MEPGVFADGFAGTHAVGRFMQSAGWTVLANDSLYFSYTVGMAHLHTTDMAGLVEQLNTEARAAFADPRWDSTPFFDAYCEGGAGGRLYFSRENGRAIAAVRRRIEEHPLNVFERAAVVASLVQAADRVANVASVYGAYLKKVKASARKPLVLEPLISAGGPAATVTCMDISDFLDKFQGVDVLYLDPPYNHRQYAPNYHILETIARDDMHLWTPKGKTGLRPYQNQKSPWCSKRQALASLDATVQAADAKVVMLSYSDEGLMAHEDILSTLQRYGNVATFEEELPRFRSDRDSAKRQYSERTTIVERIYVLDRRPPAA
jgi:adenine-specific DNA-methyltransferase